jgi:hypothetical protein
MQSKTLSLFALILFVISLILVVFGAIKMNKSRKTGKLIPNEVLQVSEKKTDEDISGYFNNENISETSEKVEDIYLANDPFREVCKNSGSDGKTPVIYGNTVCLR